MLTIAIVGRPNVGKSTLFNRLVGRRSAITLQEPGTTRDRNIRRAEWLGRQFWVIDTGGLVPDADDVITREIETQVELALTEADAVLLLVDAREGLNPVDIEIAHRLQRRKKPFMLVANKADNRVPASALAEFYRLGVKEMYPISAEHGIGVDDVLLKLFAEFPEPAVDTTPDAIKLVILGRPNVGKSSFLNALLGTNRSIVSEIPGTTRDTVEATFQLDGQNYRIVDTAGIRRKSRVDAPVEFFSVMRAMRTIEEADVAIMMLDVREGITLQDQRIAARIEDKGRGMVIVANKADLLADDAEKVVREWLGSTITYIRHVPIVFASALEGKGVSEVIVAARRVYAAGAVRMTNARLKEALMPVLEAHPPHRGAVVQSIRQKGIRPPTFTVKASDPKAIDDAYAKFVERQLRAMSGFEGYPVRIRLGR